MIQRIQSLYILLATVLLALSAQLPLMSFMSADGDYQLAASGITQADSVILATTPLLILILVAAAFNAFAFISFRKRMLQVRALVFSIILQLGSYGLGAYYLLQIKDSIVGPAAFSIPMTFPLVAAILSFLALRAIGKDEALVKSLDRIR